MRFATPAVVKKTCAGDPVVGVTSIVIGKAPVVVGFQLQIIVYGVEIGVVIEVHPGMRFPPALKVTFPLRSSTVLKVAVTPLRYTVGVDVEYVSGTVGRSTR